jgi:hypothetical protein
MLNRTLILGIAALIFVAVGFATGFFELIVLGAVAAVVAVAPRLRRQPTAQTRER